MADLGASGTTGPLTVAVWLSCTVLCSTLKVCLWQISLVGRSGSLVCARDLWLGSFFNVSDSRTVLYFGKVYIQIFSDCENDTFFNFLRLSMWMLLISQRYPIHYRKPLVWTMHKQYLAAELVLAGMFVLTERDLLRIKSILSRVGSFADNSSFSITFLTWWWPINIITFKCLEEFCPFRGLPDDTTWFPD